MNPNTANARLLKGLLARLEMDSDFGVNYVSATDNIKDLLAQGEKPPPPLSPAEPSPSPLSEMRKDAPPPPPPPRRRESTARTTRIVPAGDIISLVPCVEGGGNSGKEAALAQLRAECMQCEACELCQRRNSVVWGEGNLDTGVMFIGEGPGRDEDLEGRPFVGRSGRLLTDIIEKGMKTPRCDVYIANVVKCRPPGNRDPKPDEVAACSRYLTKQIEVISPRVIVAVGNVAARALLGLRPEASGLRGRWHDYHGIPMRVIYHPSYLLRQRRGENDRTEADKTTWKDIQDIMARLDGRE